MKILMISQRYNEGHSKATRYEKSRHLDGVAWISRYTTNIPISVVTADAVTLIKNLVYKRISDVLHIDCIERNGRTKLWEFSVTTGSENMLFYYEEPVPDEDVLGMMDMAQDWYANRADKVLYSGMYVVAAGVENRRFYALLYNRGSLKQVFIE